MEPLLNHHLWLLTGRCEDFVTPSLNTGLRYGDAEPAPEIVRARRLLWLHDTTTDFYVVGAMAALASAGTAVGEDLSALFMRWTLRVAPPTIAGGSLRPSGPGYPMMLHRPTSLPVARRWYVTRTSSAEVDIRSSANHSTKAPFRMVGGVVYVEWTPAVGFEAAFAPTGGVWEDGSQVIITSEPSGYPYPAVAESIRQSHDLLRLMAGEGTLSAFHSSLSSLQKVGALAAAMVLRGAKDNHS